MSNLDAVQQLRTVRDAAVGCVNAAHNVIMSSLGLGSSISRDDHEMFSHMLDAFFDDSMELLNPPLTSLRSRYIPEIRDLIGLASDQLGPPDPIGSRKHVPGHEAAGLLAGFVMGDLMLVNESPIQTRRENVNKAMKKLIQSAALRGKFIDRIQAESDRAVNLLSNDPSAWIEPFRHKNLIDMCRKKLDNTKTHSQIKGSLRRAVKNGRVKVVDTKEGKRYEAATSLKWIHDMRDESLAD